MRSLLWLAQLRLRLWFWLRDRDSPFFHDFSGVRTVPASREEWLVDLCRGKRVLHLGFVDSPFTEERVQNGELLHLRLKNVASHLGGLDGDAEAVRLYSTLTGDRNVGVLDLHENPDPAVVSDDYDVVILGEVLEHLLNPGHALLNVRRICELNGNAQLCVTVPNAFSAPGVIAAMQAAEIIHPEHYSYYSPVTLNRLLRDTGFAEPELLFAGPSFLRGAPGLMRPALIALAIPDLATGP